MLHSDLSLPQIAQWLKNAIETLPDQRVFIRSYIGNDTSRYTCSTYDLLLVCFTAGGRIDINFEEYDINDMSFFLIPKKNHFRFSKPRADMAYTIFIDKPFLDFVYTGLGISSFNKLFSKVQPLYLSRQETYLVFDPLIRLIGYSHSAKYIHYFTFIVTYGLLVILNSRIDNNELFFESVLSFVNTNYRAQFATKDCLDKLPVKISVTHLNRLTKKYTGRTVQQLREDRVIRDCKMLLLTTDKNIAEIATIFDYESTSRFITLFAKHTNYTPSKFRQMFKLGYNK